MSVLKCIFSLLADIFLEKKYKLVSETLASTLPQEPLVSEFLILMQAKRSTRPEQRTYKAKVPRSLRHL